MRVLGESVSARYLEQLGRAAPPPSRCARRRGAALARELDGLPVVFPRDGYQGDYISEIAAELREQPRRRAGGRARRRASSARSPQQTRSSARSQATLDALGIRFDVYYERDDALRGRQARGDARRPARAGIWSTRPTARVWLRATALGLDARPRAGEAHRRADLSAARHRLSPRQVRAAASTA